MTETEWSANEKNKTHLDNFLCVTSAASFLSLRLYIEPDKSKWRVGWERPNTHNTGDDADNLDYINPGYPGRCAVVCR
jgi:hypothetical protein